MTPGELPRLNTPGLTMPKLPELPAAQVLASLKNYGGDVVNEGGWLTICKALDARVLLEAAGKEKLLSIAADTELAAGAYASVNYKAQGCYQSSRLLRALAALLAPEVEGDTREGKEGSDGHDV